MNIIGNVINEECTPGQFYYIPFGELYDKLVLWCISAGYDEPSKKKTSQLLMNMGYRRGKTDAIRLIKGLKWKEVSDIVKSETKNHIATWQDGIE